MADLSTQQLAVFVTSQLLVGKHNPSRDELETAAERALTSSAQHRGRGRRPSPTTHGISFDRGGSS